MHEGITKTWLPSKGVTPLLKATLPTCVLSRRGLSLHQHAPRSSPYDTGAGSCAPCKLTQGRRSQTTAREEGNHPAVIGVPPFSPKPAGERADRHAGGMQPHHGCAPFRLHRIWWVSVKARARMSCNRCNGYCMQGNRTATCANAAPSRLRNRCHDSRQPCARPSSANQAHRSRVSQPREKARRSIWPKVGRQ